MMHSDFEVAAGLVPAPMARARFFMAPIARGVESTKEGRPVDELIEHIEINYPGEHTKVFIGPVEERHVSQFAEQYQAWRRNGHPETIKGTLLEQWAALRREVVERYNVVGLYTVEQLAALSDAEAAKLGSDGVMNKKKATSWLAEAKSGATVLELQEKLEFYEARIRQLEESLKQALRKAKDK